MNRSHGHYVGGRPSSERSTYNNMVSRCTNPKNKCWHLYGGRGVVVCDRWLSSFENFLADMGPKPSRQHTLDRADNSLGYEKSNCRWATASEQGRNKRSNRNLTFLSLTLCLAEWAERTGLSAQTIRTRLARKWTVERALTEPAVIGKNRGGMRFDERDFVRLNVDASGPNLTGAE